MGVIRGIPGYHKLSLLGSAATQQQHMEPSHDFRGLLVGNAKSRDSSSSTSSRCLRADRQRMWAGHKCPGFPSPGGRSYRAVASVLCGGERARDAPAVGTELLIYYAELLLARGEAAVVKGGQGWTGPVQSKVWGQRSSHRQQQRLKRSPYSSGPTGALLRTRAQADQGAARR